MAEKLDEIDIRILELLQADGRIKRNRIAEEVGLSVPSVSERMRKLEDKGIIQGYTAILSPKRLDLDVTAFIRVMVDSSQNYGEFVKSATNAPDVLEVHSITGEGSHIIKVRTHNTGTLEQLLSRIQSWPGVQGTLSSIVLTTFKETSNLPVEEVDIPVPQNGTPSKK